MKRRGVVAADDVAIDMSPGLEHKAWTTIEHYSIIAPLVRRLTCNESWARDLYEGSAKELRSKAGFAALVTNKSKMELRKAAEVCDGYLLSEMGFARQYDRYDDDSEHLAYLWADPTTEDSRGRIAVYGACCFRNRHYPDHETPYALQWVWFHPYARHRGHLTRAWPYFRARFGLFIVEPPFSAQMRRFLANKTDYNSFLEARGFPKIQL